MPKGRIMIVEDEAVAAMHIESHLLAMGYKVCSIVSSGLKALVKIRQDKPDLVLMDIKLKGPMDGIETALEIRDHSEVPVIFLTAFADQPILERAKAAEPFSYLLKPFNAKELSSNIEMALYKAKMEQSLRKSEERFRTVADYTYEWETWQDPEGKYLYVSPSCQRISGYPPDEFYKDPGFFLKIVHSEDRETVAEFIDECGRDDEVHRQEFRIIASSGSERWLEHISQNVVRDDGTWLGQRATNRDITEQKAMEQARRESERRYRSLFSHSPVPLWEQDLSAVKEYIDQLAEAGMTNFWSFFENHPEEVVKCARMVRILAVNEVCLKFFEAVSQEDLLSNFENVLAPESMEVFREYLCAIARRQAAFRTEGIYRTLSGHGRHAATYWTALPGCEKSLKGVLVSIIDITERKKIEDEFVAQACPHCAEILNTLRHHEPVAGQATI